MDNRDGRPIQIRKPALVININRAERVGAGLAIIKRRDVATTAARVRCEQESLTAPLGIFKNVSTHE
jgi:hypothetical protein